MPRILIATLLLLSTFVARPAHAASLADRLSGRILISVEEHGEAWYVDPVTKTRDYLERPEEALRVLHTKALGIKNAQLFEIPLGGSSNFGNLDLRRRLSGRVLLQVEAHGEAWYVNPVDLKRYPLQSNEDALYLMRAFGLGITRANLTLIPVGDQKRSATILNEVVFTSQAPLGEWNDPRQADGCEEASVFMAVSWARNSSFTPTEARDEIVSASDWELQTYGYSQDTSVQDTADRLFRKFYDFQNVAVRNNISTDDIRRALENGQLVVTAINGQKIGNPYYTGAGPLRHMLLVVGYDANTDEFIVHDPGTRYGAYMRFSSERLQNALQDYTSGEQAPVGAARTAMIVVAR